ncbi:MAG: phosphoglycerate dehydrogenase [Planctomycetota bacterium]|nr:phosphoglycerate dehydrogenase [Planctomycetota bacterium]MDA1211607.1 phosphoglycerate dehydrogenase [Planctomycetota bacterium]
MSKYRVLITDNLSKAGLEVLQKSPEIEVDVRSGLSPEQVREAMQTADAIIIRSGTTLTPALLEGQKRLKAIVRAGVGVDNIDLPSATREGIVVMNTPAGNTTSTAEHTIAMLMALSRNIGPAAASMKAGKWDRKKYTGTQLAGKTLAVVGLGRIGQAVARRARGLEMRIVGYDPFLSTERAAEQGIELYRDIDDLIPLCDVLTVHTPLSDETRGLINAERLAKMKPGVRIINCARGGIVDEEALADALESGHVAGAALDVYVNEPPGESRLVTHPHVLATPHLGASTDEAQELVAVEAAEILTGFLLRNEVRHAVNMVPITAKEMEGIRMYLDVGYRLGLLLSQLNKSGGVKSAHLQYKGEAASKQTKLITASFAAGLMCSAFDEGVNIVNAEMMAHERGIEITESSSTEVGHFSTLVQATIVTNSGELSAAGTTFGQEYLRLVRLGEFQLDAYLDGLLLIYRHRDVPGLIGFIGTIFGKHQVNIAHMALGREKNVMGGDAVAVLNLDNDPSAEALAEVSKHPEVTRVEVVRLPEAGAPLPWLVSG